MSTTNAKLIYPDSKIGEKLVLLLEKPNAPVSRAFIDKMLNRSKNKEIERIISDTLIWLHLMDRVCRAYANLGDFECVTESGVYFWLPEKTDPGWVNAERNYEKYHVEQLTSGGIPDVHDKVPPKPTEQANAEGASGTQDPAPEQPTTSVGDARAESSSEVVDDAVEVQTAAMPMRTPVDFAEALGMSTDKTILHFAADGRVFGVDDVEKWCPKIGLPAMKMRLGILVRKGKLLRNQHGTAYILAGADIPLGFIREVFKPEAPKLSKEAKKLLDEAVADSHGEGVVLQKGVGKDDYTTSIINTAKQNITRTHPAVVGPDAEEIISLVVGASRAHKPSGGTPEGVTVSGHTHTHDPSPQLLDQRRVVLSSDVLCRLGSDGVLDLMGADEHGNVVPAVRIEGVAYRKLMWFLRSGMSDMSEFK